MKMDDAVVELINKSIDGMLLPNEAERLKEILGKNQHVREIYEEFSSASRMLASVKEVEPPAGLALNVMGAIERTGSRKQSAKEPFFAGFVAAVREMVTLKYAYTFSAGLVAGALLLLVFVQSLDGSSADPSGASGTIVMPIERAEVNLQQIRGFIQTKRGDHLLSVDLNLSANANVVTRIDYDSKAVHVGSVKLPESHSTDLKLQNQSVEIQGTGEMKYTVTFFSRGQSAPPVNVSIFSAGEVIYEKSIALER